MESIEATGDVLKPNCPSRMVVERLGERWTLLVLIALRRGPVRFTALREMIGVVTPKVLTQTLRGLEHDGLVLRTVYPEIPPRVEYQLTGLGISLMDPVDALRQWSETNGLHIVAARDAADRQS
ncbi:helix-turn-helix domain-containing protein [Nocardia sp. 348MFTsu5.1]|uniref:winged helix-turn-helix transcriptional regulator n=1 Tax=Nocardia sp. 348MFTsu5.1 TaxID=1172185 RepID=UPI000381FFC8|nr:helix-turn-helix domain-containing protein [Nocardia sp. 348MFTsu5.1]